MYDLIIIGMGISGISAALYAKDAGLNVLMLDSYVPGGTLNRISEITNYPGFSKISGPDLALNLIESVNSKDIPYKLEEVTDVILEEIKTIKTTKNVYQCKNLLIATGRKPKFLGLKHEQELIGKGISTCALCDGALYKNKDVAVVGGGASALTEALYLSNICHKVYLIHRKDNFRDASFNQRISKKNNIEVHLNDEITELIVKDKTLQGLKLKNSTINISGLFIYIGSTPNTEFLANTALKMENGYLIVNDKYETNIKGVYGSGDVILKNVYQLITGASEGAQAAINIFQNK